MIFLVGILRPRMTLPHSGSPLRIVPSAAVAVVAHTLISTALSLGAGFFTSMSWRTSGGPYSVYTIAFIRSLQGRQLQ